MNYNKIKDDIYEFKKILKDIGLFQYGVIAPIFLELCLKEKGINSRVVLGYIVKDDEFYDFQLWNKIDINGQVKQIDPSALSLVSPFNIKYTLSLKDKWRYLSGAKEAQRLGHIHSMNYADYKNKGALHYLENFINNAPLESIKTDWKKVIKKAKNLETFEYIEKFDIF